MMRKFKLFGFYICISREPFKAKPRDKKRNAYRDSQRNLRPNMVDKQELSYPTATPDRCTRPKFSEQHQAIVWRMLARTGEETTNHGYQHLEDNTRYGVD